MLDISRVTISCLFLRFVLIFKDNVLQYVNVCEYVIRECESWSATWPSGTARRSQILCDGFDSRLEPIAFDMYV